MLLQIRRDAFPGIEPYYTNAPSPADHADDVAVLHAKATALSSLQQLAAHPQAALVRLQPQAAKFVELGPLYVLVCVCVFVCDVVHTRSTCGSCFQHHDSAPGLAQVHCRQHIRGTGGCSYQSQAPQGEARSPCMSMRCAATPVSLTCADVALSSIPPPHPAP